MLTAQRSAFPNATIYCLNIFPRTSMTAAQLAPYRANIAAAVSGMSDSKILYVDVTNWGLNPSSYGDGLHPNATDQAIIANRLAQLIAPSAPSRAAAPTHDSFAFALAT